MVQVAGMHRGCGKVESNRIERFIDPDPSNRWSVGWDGTHSVLGPVGCALTGSVA